MPAGASSLRKGPGASISSASPPAPGRDSRPAAAHRAARDATVPATTDGGAATPRILVSARPSSQPRTSTRTAPVRPSGWGGRSIGNHEVRRSRRVASSRDVTRLQPGKGRDQQQRIGQAGSVAVGPSDRLGKPHQLPPRATPAPAPLPFLPVDGSRRERGVVAAGASRAASSDAGHVHLVHPVQMVAQVRGQHAAEARGHGRSDGQRPLAGSSQRVQTEQTSHLRRVVGDTHHVATGDQRRLGRPPGPVGRSHQGHVGRRELVHRPFSNLDLGAELLDHGAGPERVPDDDHERINGRGASQASRHPSADGAQSDENGAHSVQLVGR